MIEVSRIGDGDRLEFDVKVRTSGRENFYRVTIGQAYCEQLTHGKHTPEHCIEADFRFLLDRESMDSILDRFDVSVIPRYYPQFEKELPRYLSQAQFRA